MAKKYKCPNCGILWIEQTRCSCGTLVDIKPIEVGERNGYDRYLDYQYRRSGGFFSNLFDAIRVADKYNLAKLRKGFPDEVDAYLCWSRIGVGEFAKRCGNKASQLYMQFLKEYGLEELIDG